MSYTLYFIGHSFQSELPWQRCDPEWANGTNCTVRSKNVFISLIIIFIIIKTLNNLIISVIIVDIR